MNIKACFLLTLIVVTLGLFVPAKAFAACPGVNTNVNSVTQTITVPLTGTYSIWSRIFVPDSTNTSFLLQIDTTCFTVGNASLVPINTWTWVNYQDGNPNNPISQTLASGTHTLKLLGYKPHVKVDKIIFTQDTCIPQGLGDNCNAPITVNPTGISPTFVCIGGIPCTSPDPTSTDTPPSTTPGTQTPTGNTNSPTIDPCNAGGTVSTQATPQKKHRKNRGGSSSFLDQFILWLIQFLTELLKQLGIIIPTPGPNPIPTPIVNPTQSPSATPSSPCTNPGQPSVTPAPTSIPAGLSPTNTTTLTPPSTQGSWPGATNTGVPPGTVLAAYAGPTTISSCGVIIDSKIINSGLIIRASNGTHSATTPCVTIRNSKINGQIDTSYSDQKFGPLLITDSEIAIPTPNNGTFASLTQSNWYAWRLNIHGGRTNTQCDGYCELHDSWIHDNFYVSPSHMGGFLSNGNYGNPILIDHNSISCTLVNPAAQDSNGGCSGDINFYGDFSATSNITVTNNIFRASLDPSYCAYTGAHQTGKPFPDGTHLIWENNVWELGNNSKCATYGPVADWANNAGNVWSNNIWSTGGDVLTTH